MIVPSIRIGITIALLIVVFLENHWSVGAVCTLLSISVELLWLVITRLLKNMHEEDKRTEEAMAKYLPMIKGQ